MEKLQNDVSDFLLFNFVGAFMNRPYNVQKAS